MHRILPHHIVSAALAVTLAAVGLAACRDTVAPAASRSPIALAAKAKFDKVAVCHASGSAEDPRFHEITVAAPAAEAHLREHGDYLVTPRTLCPPPAEPGVVEVCKADTPGIRASSPFTFDVAGEEVTVFAGEACVARQFRVGTTVTVRELAHVGSALAGIAIEPVAAGAVDVDAETATVVAGTDVARITFTNRSLTFGQLTVCKIAGPGIPVGLEFQLSGGERGSTAIPAGAAPEGTCVDMGPVRAGTTVVRESPSPGAALTGVVVVPAGALVTSDLATRTATVRIAAGELTRVTLTNAATIDGQLLLCKDASVPGIMPGTLVGFRLVAPRLFEEVAVASGTCASVGPFQPGTVLYIGEVLQNSILQQSTLTSVVVEPADRLFSVNLGARVASVWIGAGRTVVRFTNERRVGNVQVCNRGGDGVTGTFSFVASGFPTADFPGPSAQVPVGACQTLYPFMEQPTVGTTVWVRELLPDGLRVSDVVVTHDGVMVTPTTLDLARNGYVAFPLAEGLTTVTYTNVR